MKIAFITAGAAGMFCGSCMHDNTLVTALLAQGHDALLLPTYTPIRTDEADVSNNRVFFGGINVYLQQKSRLFQWTPWFLDRLLDFPRLLRWVSRFAMSTRAEQLGDLTLSILQGEHGHQRKEIDKLVDWLATSHRPDIIQISNVLLSGMVPRLKKVLKVPVLGTLQGDDIFLESLPPAHRQKALDLIHENDRHFDGYLATSRYYADFMAEYLRIPRERIHVVYPGLNLKGHCPVPTPARPFTIGFFARISPEKGFRRLIEAFCEFKKLPGTQDSQLRASGWFGEHNRRFYEDAISLLKQAGIADAFQYMESPDHAAKVKFLHGIDVLSVPTVYHEPKGLYVLEALANGVPVVQPRHGSFPELIEATGGGLLVEPNDPVALAKAWQHLMEHPDERKRLGVAGDARVRERFHAAVMATETIEVYRRFLSGQFAQTPL